MSRQTQPTHPTEIEPQPKTGVYQATSAGLAQYIKRSKQSGVPLNTVGREVGYVLTEFDALVVRYEALEQEVAALKSELAKSRKKEG